MNRYGTIIAAAEVCHAASKWTGPIRDWKTLHNHFIIELGNRVGDHVYVNGVCGHNGSNAGW